MKEPREILRAPFDESVEIERPFEAHTPSVGRYPSYRSEAQASVGIQLSDYWRAIRKRLWLVIGIVVLLTTLSAIYMARKPNIYEARAKVQVDNEQANQDVQVNDRQQRSISGGDPSYFNTQIQLLRSDSLLRRVVKEHNLDQNKEFVQARAEGSTSPWRSVLRSLGLATDDKKEKTNISDFGESSVATSEDIAEAVRLAPFVDIIKRNLEIDPVREAQVTVKDTRLIELAFRSSNPDLAANVVNAIAETFMNSNQEKRSGTSRKTNDFLQERKAALETDIQQDTERLVVLKDRAGIVSTGEAGQTIVVDRLSGLNKALLEAENDRKDAESKYMQVKDSPDKIKALADAEVARFTTEQENNIRALQADTIKKINDLRNARIEKLQLFEEGAPELKQIDSQIKSYEDGIDNAVARFQRELESFRKRAATIQLENLRTKYLQAKDKEEKFRTDFNKQFGEAQVQNSDAVNITLLQQRIDTNRGFLENLAKQVSGNDIAAQGTDNNISVIEIAIPPEVAVSPRRLTTVVAAMFLSTLFGMGLALFLEFLDDTIKTTEEIENYLQLPALAAIPAINSLPKRKLLLVGANEEEAAPTSPLLISADSRSPLAEAYRHLRTSILLSTAGHAPKSLLITSSLPSEGKTTTATNTALSLAQTGARVLIIDADMRRPRLHSVFGIENGVGLSTLLSSELGDREIANAVRQDERSKLFLLTSGPIPPNPAELIGSEQMSKLMKMLQERFTHVVVDSPPIASFTDGVLIASMVDGVILVVHSGRSSRQVVRKSRQLLTEIGAKVLGVVLNNVNLNTKDNYYYYQSYYHRSNYTSGDE